MKIIASIGDEEVIKTSVTISIDNSDSQVQFSTPTFHPDPEYLWIQIGFLPRGRVL